VWYSSIFMTHVFRRERPLFLFAPEIRTAPMFLWWGFFVWWVRNCCNPSAVWFVIHRYSSPDFSVENAPFSISHQKNGPLACTSVRGFFVWRVRRCDNYSSVWFIIHRYTLRNFFAENAPFLSKMQKNGPHAGLSGGVLVYGGCVTGAVSAQYVPQSIVIHRRTFRSRTLHFPLCTRKMDRPQVSLALG
jgi:hypothetical protein